MSSDLRQHHPAPLSQLSRPQLRDVTLTWVGGSFYTGNPSGCLKATWYVLLWGLFVLETNPSPS